MKSLVVCFPAEILKSIEVVLERFKEVIEENVMPWEVDGRLCVQRDVSFRYEGEIVKFFAGIVDISPNPNFGEPPCEIRKPLLLVYFKEETFVFMIKTALYRNCIPELLVEVAEEIKNLTEYDYFIKGMSY